MVKRTSVKLSNGMRLFVVEIPHSKSAVVSYWTKAGTRFNPFGKDGLAHFTEHLLVQKCKKYPTSEKLAFALEKIGAFRNGTTGKDRMNLRINCAADSASYILEILYEMVANPLIDDDSIKTERGIIEKEIIRKASRPEDLVWDKWFKIFFFWISFRKI